MLRHLIKRNHLWQSGTSLKADMLRHTRISQIRLSGANGTEKAQIEQGVKYDIVYRFPYIVPVRLMSRFKIYQTTGTLVVVPLIYNAVKGGDIATQTVTTISVAALMALGTLYYLSNITRKLVCLIGVTEDQRHVRLSRMTFWGNRKDVVLPIEDIVPFTEISTSFKDVYTDIKTYDGSVHLHLPLRFGGIQDLEQFQNIFGDLRNQK